MARAAGARAPLGSLPTLERHGFRVLHPLLGTFGSTRTRAERYLVSNSIHKSNTKLYLVSKSRRGYG